jgi:hypothetical protein
MQGQAGAMRTMTGFHQIFYQGAVQGSHVNSLFVESTTAPEIQPKAIQDSRQSRMLYCSWQC